MYRGPVWATTIVINSLHIHLLLNQDNQYFIYFTFHVVRTAEYACLSLTFVELSNICFNIKIKLYSKQFSGTVYRLQHHKGWPVIVLFVRKLTILI